MMYKPLIFSSFIALVVISNVSCVGIIGQGMSPAPYGLWDRRVQNRMIETFLRMVRPLNSGMNALYGQKYYNRMNPSSQNNPLYGSAGTYVQQKNQMKKSRKSGSSRQNYRPIKSRNHYVPVVVKQKTKKHKVIQVVKGQYIPDGQRLFGKFKSLKSCMKACAIVPSCFAGDYDPWLGRCYIHDYETSCNTMEDHSKITHFKKVPCSVTLDRGRVRIFRGSRKQGGLLMKGIDDLKTCLKKCATAGSGVAPSPGSLLSTPFFGGQLCFGFEYDFSSHSCYFFNNLYEDRSTRTINLDCTFVPEVGPNPAECNAGNTETRISLSDSLCPTVNNAGIPTPEDLVDHSSSVYMSVCPPIS